MSWTDPGVMLLSVVAVAVIAAGLLGYGTLAVLSRRTRDANFWQESSPVSTIERRQARRIGDLLVASCDEAEIEVPRPTIVSITDTTATIFLDRPCQVAPPPWEVGPDGLSWRAALDDLDELGRSAAVHRAPDALVAMGRTDVATVFVDLAACPGVVNIVGNRQMARKLVRRWITELTQPPWRVDFTAGVIEDSSLLTGRSMRWARTIRADAGRDFRGGYLAVATTECADAVETMITSSRRDGQRGAAAVVIGPMRQAAWQLRVGAHGRVTSPVLPTTDLRDPFVPLISKHANRLANRLPWRVGPGRVAVDPVEDDDAPRSSPGPHDEVTIDHGNASSLEASPDLGDRSSDASLRGEQRSSATNGTGDGTEFADEGTSIAVDDEALAPRKDNAESEGTPTAAASAEPRPGTARGECESVPTDEWSLDGVVDSSASADDSTVGQDPETGGSATDTESEPVDGQRGATRPPEVAGPSSVGDNRTLPDITELSEHDESAESVIPTETSDVAPSPGSERTSPAGSEHTVPFAQDEVVGHPARTTTARWRDEASNLVQRARVPETDVPETDIDGGHRRQHRGAESPIPGSTIDEDTRPRQPERDRSGSPLGVAAPWPGGSPATPWPGSSDAPAHDSHPVGDGEAPLAGRSAHGPVEERAGEIHEPTGEWADQHDFGDTVPMSGKVIKELGPQTTETS